MSETARQRVEAALADWFEWDDSGDGLPTAHCRWCGWMRRARMRETTPAFIRSEMEALDQHDPDCLTRLVAAALAEADAMHGVDNPVLTKLLAAQEAEIVRLVTLVARWRRSWADLWEQAVHTSGHAGALRDCPNPACQEAAGIVGEGTA